MNAEQSSSRDAGGVTTAVREGALVMCEEVSRTFGHDSVEVTAARAVSCSVEPGTRVALTGPSGSGKSTLLHLLAGLDQPTGGTVSWPGLGGSPRARPGIAGVIFQGPSLVPALDVVENVALPLLLGGVGEQSAVDRAVAALDRLRIADLACKLPEELSGGQAQRVAVARVLASRPLLILADEPTGQLDHDTGQLVVSVLLETARELGAALVVSTHDVRVAQRLACQWRMDDGRLSIEEPV
jgi:ABC-type lipoprotein export system ATPase subunit